MDLDGGAVAPGDGGEHPELGRGQDPVGDRDPQHGREALDVEPVHEPQGLELLLAQLPGEVARGLLTEVGDPLPDELPVEGVSYWYMVVSSPVHGRCAWTKKAATRFPGWRLSGVGSWLGVPEVGSAWAQRGSSLAESPIREFRIQMQQQMKRTKEIIWSCAPPVRLRRARSIGLPKRHCQPIPTRRRWSAIPAGEWQNHPSLAIGQRNRYGRYRFLPAQAETESSAPDRIEPGLKPEPRGCRRPAGGGSGDGPNRRNEPWER